MPTTEREKEAHDEKTEIELVEDVDVDLGNVILEHFGEHQQTTNFVTIPTSINKHPQRFHKLPQTHKESQSLQNIK